MSIAIFASEFLGFLELREARLLSWGFYDVSFTPKEIEAVLQNEAPAELQSAWAACIAAGWTLENLLEDMETVGLLFRPGKSAVYRTRFAEGIRLTARLRQMFNYDQWPIAPNLVSDIKLHLRPRQYPRQDQPAGDCWQALAGHCKDAPLQKELFEALSSDQAGRPYQFAGFQRRVFEHVLSHYGQPGVSGTIVCAGTGSGKTKAFYVPALLSAAVELKQRPFTKVIAIYPRNVLLADQLREAISEAEKLRPVLQKGGLRPLRFGALLGNTPRKDSFDRMKDGQPAVEVWHDWRPIGTTGFRIPFLKSPKHPGEDLVWKHADRKAGRSCLYRVGSEDPEPDVPDGVLALTREALMAEPPDVLFLSAEMLNREMGNPDWSRTFGIGQGTLAPRLLLLDEVHSYEGIQGAQIAWVLRRWRYWARAKNLHVVGLSATLKQATRHLGLVAGISQERISEFQPAENELTRESMEYNVAVKGDPASGTSLLATSIQCGMLLSRLLTPRHLLPSPETAPLKPEAFYGRKIFGFTDNLDGVNRWLSDMDDAEQSRGLARLRLHPLRRQPPPTPPPSPAQLLQMEAQGQIWELPRRLHHDLERPLLITRCSSQDPGADANADLIVATSALEVGFDDPDVGAVLQHKRPISMASFLQRKGRAGRRRGTRPWTVVILSDYGGDRWAFHQAERLFEPELESLRLAIHNPYVLRIQATYFLLDWLGRRIGGGPFDFLRRPDNYTDRQKRTIVVLEDFLKQGAEWKAFRKDYELAFGRTFEGRGDTLSPAELDALLWEAPRPLLRHVVPNLLRKLQAGWSYANPQHTGGLEDERVNHPLPGYLPKSTFSDLDLAEARLQLRYAGGRQRDEFLSISRALFESCPGRVSKRYSTGRGEFGFWHPFSERCVDGPVTASVRDLYPDRLALGVVNGVTVYQIQATQLQHRPTKVLDSSNSTWQWNSVLQAFGDGLPLPLFKGRRWDDVVQAVTAFLHRDQAGIEVLRYAGSCRYEIRRQKKDPIKGRLILQTDAPSGGQPTPEAVGFRQRVDGICITLKREHLQTQPLLGEALEQRFRADYFLYRINNSPALSDRINPFLAEWLWQTSLGMLTATAGRQKCSLADAQTHLAGVRSRAADRVLQNIFQIRGVTPTGEELEGRMSETIRALWDDPAVVAAMETLEGTLWAAPDDDYRTWVKRRYVATLAQAIRSAIVARQDEIAEDDLNVDVIWAEDGTADIYLTEMNSGGLGQIETIVHQLLQEPHLLHDGVRHFLSHCPRFDSTRTLLSVLERGTRDPADRPLPQAFEQVRLARGFAALERAKQSLRTALEQEGFLSSRPTVVSVVTRLLRPGSSRRTDELMLFVNRSWRKLERKLKLGIDARVFAYVCLQRGPLNRRMQSIFSEVSGGVPATDPQMYALLQQFLLLDCQDSCRECLDFPNPYNDFGRPSRDLARLWLGLTVPELSVDDHPADWQARAQDLLQQAANVRLCVSNARIAEVTAVLPALLAEELEVDYLLLPVSIRRIEQEGALWKITLQLKEALHA